MWAAGMIAAGHLANRIGRKPAIVAGMLIQTASLAVIAVGIAHALAAGLTGAFLLGAGAAPGLPHPAGLGQRRHPPRRAGIRPGHLPVLA
jgi:MFS family permease